MADARASCRSDGPAGIQPLAAKKWRAILVATLVLVLAFWALLEGLVAEATNDGSSSEVEPNAAIGLAVGLTVIPFVFVALAFLSEHPRPRAVVRAMGWSLLVGIPGRRSPATRYRHRRRGRCGGHPGTPHGRTPELAGLGRGRWWLPRSTFKLGALPAGWVLPAPIFLLTAIGVADHLSERKAEQTADQSDSRASGGRRRCRAPRATPCLEPRARSTSCGRGLRSELSGAPPARSRA